jgi:hypothetical protein
LPNSGDNADCYSQARQSDACVDAIAARSKDNLLKPLACSRGRKVIHRARQNIRDGIADAEDFPRAFHDLPPHPQRGQMRITVHSKVRKWANPL